MLTTFYAHLSFFTELPSPEPLFPDSQMLMTFFLLLRLFFTELPSYAPIFKLLPSHFLNTRWALADTSRAKRAHFLTSGQYSACGQQSEKA
jgi:hypothetical protein